jgi:integrase
MVVTCSSRARSPKTDRSQRTVTLDPGTVAVLREHRRRMLAERLALGAEFTHRGLVFHGPDGDPLHPARFSREFTRAVDRTDLPRIQLHDLRHGWATMALSAGVHPKVVQRLGHSSITVTLDVYSHVTEGLHENAANLVGGLIAGEAR